MAADRPTALDLLVSSFARTRATLFAPLRLEKYLLLAVSAWLARCGTQSFPMQGTGSPSTPASTGVGWPPDPSEVQEALEPILAWGPWLVLFGGLAFGLGLVFAAVAAFLQSRGNFMFVDNLVRGRAEVAAPWREQAELADRLFWFRVTLGVVGASVGVVGIGLAGAAAWLTWGPSGPSFAGLAATGSVFAVGGLVGAAIGLLDWLVTELAAPVMYVRRGTVGDALRDLRSLAGADLGAFVGYLVVRMLLAIGLGVLGGTIGCLFFCVSWVPFVGTVLLLPLHVYARWFSLGFVASLDEDLAVLAPR